MRKIVVLLGVVAIVAGIGMLSGEEQTEAAGGPFISPFCPTGPLACPDLYAPVTCSNGVTYSNICYARLSCAEDCVPADGF